MTSLKVCTYLGLLNQGQHVQFLPAWLTVLELPEIVSKSLSALQVSYPENDHLAQ